MASESCTAQAASGRSIAYYDCSCSKVHAMHQHACMPSSTCSRSARHLTLRLTSCLKACMHYQKLAAGTSLIPARDAQEVVSMIFL